MIGLVHARPGRGRAGGCTTGAEIDVTAGTSGGAGEDGDGVKDTATVAGVRGFGMAAGDVIIGPLSTMIAKGAFRGAVTAAAFSDDGAVLYHGTLHRSRQLDTAAPLLFATHLASGTLLSSTPVMNYGVVHGIRVAGASPIVALPFVGLPGTGVRLFPPCGACSQWRCGGLGPAPCRGVSYSSKRCGAAPRNSRVAAVPVLGPRCARSHYQRC